MTTDYKNRATRTPKAKPQSPGIVWFLAGAIFGVSLLGLAWLKFAPTAMLNDLGSTTEPQVAPLPTDLAQEVPTEPTAPTTPKPQPSTPQQLEFEFPNMLRNARVELPEQNSDTPVQPTQPPPAKPPFAVANTQPGLVAPQTASQDVPETLSPPVVTNPESSEESSRQTARQKAAARRRIAREKAVARRRAAARRKAARREAAEKRKAAREKAAARREAAEKRKAARQAAAAKRTATPRGRSTSTGKQLGAFTNAENAQALRARLALRGIETQVRTVKRNNRTLHIVVQ
jgi:cell division protein FtsN